MQLLFLRHAEAHPAASDQPDAERALTEAGLHRAYLIGKMLRCVQLILNAVYTSPYLRARQTAQAVAETLQVPLVADPLLAPGCGPAELERLVQAYAPGETLLVVGHQPDLGELVRWLTGAAVRLPPGGLAVVEAPTLRNQAGTLQGLYDPTWLTFIMISKPS